MHRRKIVNHVFMVISQKNGILLIYGLKLLIFKQKYFQLFYTIENIQPLKNWKGVFFV